MRRRDFLYATGAAAGLALPHRTAAQASTADARKLARTAMMTRNFTTLLKTPFQPPGPQRTLELFDLPQMYVDLYGVCNIGLQHYHMASTEPSY